MKLLSTSLKEFLKNIQTQILNIFKNFQQSSIVKFSFFFSIKIGDNLQNHES